eukprot:SAG11_NODE_38404_length_252_cov_1.013072_1_plen_47_part_10
MHAACVRAPKTFNNLVEVGKRAEAEVVTAAGSRPRRRSSILQSSETH